MAKQLVLAFFDNEAAADAAVDVFVVDSAHGHTKGDGIGGGKVNLARMLMDDIDRLFRALPLAATADDYEALLPWRLLRPAT